MSANDFAPPPLCGRPTRGGQPCRNPLTPWERACRLHATTEDQTIGRWANALANDAHRLGYESGRQAGRWEVEQEQRKEEQRIAAARDWRERDGQGRQLVQVGRYTYAWAGAPDLAVGDEVRLPASWLSRDGWTGTVTAVGSSYRGDVVSIVGPVAALGVLVP